MTDSDPACPSRAELLALFSGQSPTARASELELHVSSCRHCQSVWDALTGDSTLLRALRGPLPGPAQVPDDLENLVRGLESLHPLSRRGPAELPADEIGRLLAPPAVPDELGRLAHYRVLAVLGAGGMGIVLRAVDTRLGRPVALKVMRAAAGRGPESRQRFLGEARAMAALRHDHIVVVHQVEEAVGPSGEPVPFLAMELLEGQSLDIWLRANPRPAPGHIARIGRQAAEGLAAAHAAGLIHRDIKPANLWLEVPARSSADPAPGDIGRVKLLDFGLATAAGTAGGRAGTPAYMSPEQLAGDALDPRADVYALGCVLYEMATGSRPFGGLGFADGGRLQPVREVNPAVPARLSDLIDRLLSADPARRPASAALVARELAAIEARPRRQLGRRLGRAVRGTVLWGAALAFGFVGLNWLVGADPNRKAGPVVEPSHPGTMPHGPPDAAWCATVATFSPDEQAAVVIRKLVELNPDLDSQDVRIGIDPVRGTVRECYLAADLVSDIRPLAALVDLKVLGCCGSAPRSGRLRDLGPLAGLKLETLRVWNNPHLVDLAAVRALPLRELNAADTGLTSLQPLAGSPVAMLFVSNTKVSDLGPVRALPNLRTFRCEGCPIGSTGPLAGTPVVDLVLDYRAARDNAVFARMKGLQRVNYRPVPGRN